MPWTSSSVHPSRVWSLESGDKCVHHLHTSRLPCARTGVNPQIYNVSLHVRMASVSKHPHVPKHIPSDAHISCILRFHQSTHPQVRACARACASLPHRLTASPPHRLTASLPHCLTASLPHRLTDLRSISVLRLWISEGLTPAESEFQGVELSCP